MVARALWEREVAGSSPVTPTRKGGNVVCFVVNTIDYWYFSFQAIYAYKGAIN